MGVVVYVEAPSNELCHVPSIKFQKVITILTNENVFTFNPVFVEMVKYTRRAIIRILAKHC